MTVRVSTEVAADDDPRGAEALIRARAINAETEAYWRGLEAGQSAEATRRFVEARDRARRLGLAYITASDLSGRDLSQILARIEALIGRERLDDPREVAAVLGGETPPALLVSGLVQAFESINAPRLASYAPDQVRKWRAPRELVARSLAEVIGDRSISSLTRSDALDFRAALQSRVLAGEIDIATANKRIGTLSAMVKEIDRQHRLGVGTVFSELRIGGETVGQRKAVPGEWVQRVLMADGALECISPDARRLVCLLADTGLRLSEACALTRETIILDAAVPHVQVRAAGRITKTEQSVRDIPLVGAALAAAKASPDGFSRYAGKADTFSATVNKTLRAHKLLPEGCTIYGLRHGFEDRLTAVEAPEKLIAALMGHKYSRPKYGSGPSLAQKLGWLERIAFRPPASL